MSEEGFIFVFGSNMSGYHAAGAARDAYNDYGARMGKGFGLHGRSYAIPTMDDEIRTLPIHVIAFWVSKFLVFARKNPEKKFRVTRVGCGIAGYKDADIAPLFSGSPPNVEFFDPRWKYWGIERVRE